MILLFNYYIMDIPAYVLDLRIHLKEVDEIGLTCTNVGSESWLFFAPFLLSLCPELGEEPLEADISSIPAIEDMLTFESRDRRYDLTAVMEVGETVRVEVLVLIGWGLEEGEPVVSLL